MKKRILFTILMIALLLSACGSKSSLDGTQWKLINLNGETALVDVEVTLNFEKDSMGGSDGCNSYGGSYQAGETSIQFGDDIFSTEMYCSDEINTQSTTYYSVLGQVTSYMVDGQLLTLFNSEGNKLAEFIPLQN